jgi:hypothetical protein
LIGIGARGTRLTHEKVLSEESVQILEAKKNEFIKLTAGIHRFPFAFIVPNVNNKKTNKTKKTLNFFFVFYLVNCRNDRRCLWSCSTYGRCSSIII